MNDVAGPDDKGLSEWLNRRTLELVVKLKATDEDRDFMLELAYDQAQAEAALLRIPGADGIEDEELASIPSRRFEMEPSLLEIARVIEAVVRSTRRQIAVDKTKLTTDQLLRHIQGLEHGEHGLEEVRELLRNRLLDR